MLMIGEVTLAGRMISLSLLETIGNPVRGKGVVRRTEDLGDNNLVLQFLHDHGTIPLPPYIADDADKYDDYQPIVATQEGSVAAPTAALHFTDRLLDEITTK